MKKLRKHLYLGLIITLLMISGKSIEEANAQTAEPGHQQEIYEEITRLIVNMPAEEKEEEKWVNEQMTAYGAEAVQALSWMLTDPAVGSDLKARYALSSLANYTAGFGSEPGKQNFESALLAEIKKDRPIDVKDFLLEQLILTGSDRSVPVLEPLLVHERLYNNALKVLLTLNTPSAAEAVRNTLPAVDGEQKIALIKALGELEDKSSTEQLMEFAASDQWPIKRMSLNSLANIGETGSSRYFEEAIQGYEGFRESEVVSYYLHYANRLAVEGYSEESNRITEYFLQSDFAEHIKNSALQVRFHLYGEDISDELLETAQSSEALRAKSALAMINSLEESEVTEQIVDALKSAPESNKIYFIEALGDRGDESAASALRSHTGDTNSEIRIAALYSLYQLEGEIDPGLVVTVLNDVDSDEGVQRVEELLLQLESENIVKAVASALPDASLKAKPVLIRLLTVRLADEYLDQVRNELDINNENVRIAAYEYLGSVGVEEDTGTLFDQMGENFSDEELSVLQDAFASVVNRSVLDADRNDLIGQYYSEGTTDQKKQLIQVVTRIEGVDNAGILRRGLNHENREIQFAAIQSLREWNSADALPLLIGSVPMTSGEEQLAVISRYVQLVNDLDGTLNQKEQRLHELFNSMQSEDSKISALEQFEQADDLLALQAVGVYLTNRNENIRNAAYQTASNLLLPHYKEDSEGIDGPMAVLAVLNEDSREKIKSILSEKAELDSEDSDEDETDTEPKYGTLFNGINLEGWQIIGTPGTWGVEDGILFTDGDGSGWLSTENRYDNFVIELEYRVPEGGNSGLFLRSPREGNPAY
ncbi:MAG: DUF1080 domain-containing protein, partial [Balneolaceae bacterium]|nr:DUF1080 domain-containing protein [Balneolaceae bacterium]